MSDTGGDAARAGRDIPWLVRSTSARAVNRLRGVVRLAPRRLRPRLYTMGRALHQRIAVVHPGREYPVSGFLVASSDAGAATDGQMRRIVFEAHEARSRRALVSTMSAGDLCIDVGAHVGLYTLELARRAKTLGGHVLAVEPHPSNFRDLVENLRRNGLLENVMVVRAAIGDRDGHAELHLAANSGLHSTRPSPARTGLAVRTVMHTLTSLVDSCGLRSVEPSGLVLKVDVEGAELDVLAGASLLLEKVREVVVLVEYFPDLMVSVGSEPKDLINFFVQRGFSGVVVDEDTGILPLEALDTVLRRRAHQALQRGRRPADIHEAVNLIFAKGRPAPTPA